MKKFIITLLFLVTLVGCGTDNPGVTPNPGEPDDGKLVITVKNNKEVFTYQYELNDTFSYSILTGLTTTDTFMYWYYVDNGAEIKVTADIKVVKSLTIIGKYEGTTGTLPWV